MKIIFTRHGETEANKEGIIQGQLHGKLTQKGIEQAKKVGLRLKDEKIDFVYSSDLKRASDTAKEIIKYHKKIPFQYSENIREIFYGKFQGTKIADKKDWDINDPKGGETMQELCKRGKLFLDDILQKHLNDTVLMVSHGSFGRAFIASLKGINYKEIQKVEVLKNTSISIFEIDENRNCKTLISNCTEHLEK